METSLAVAALRHQSLQPHPTGRPKQIGPDLALFERGDKDAVRSAREQAVEVGLTMDSGKPRKSSPSSASTSKHTTALRRCVYRNAGR